MTEEQEGVAYIDYNVGGPASVPEGQSYIDFNAGTNPNVRSSEGVTYVDYNVFPLPGIIESPSGVMLLQQTTTQIVTLPDDLEPNDFVLLQVCLGGTRWIVDAPANWELINSTTTGSDSGNNPRQELWSHRVGPYTVKNPTFVFNGSDRGFLGLTVWRGVGSRSWDVVSATSSELGGGLGGPLTLPSVPALQDAVVLRIVTARGFSGLSFGPYSIGDHSAYSTIYGITWTTAGRLFGRDQFEEGVTGTATVTISAGGIGLNGAIGHTLVLNPGG